jgi:uncharacterized protein with von Willebrand factor type A (vWA) domain
MRLNTDTSNTLNTTSWADNEDLLRFISFGKIFDKPTRTYLVHYLSARFFNEVPPITIESSPYFLYLKKTLDNLLAYEPLFEAVKGNEVLSAQIMTDILKWIRKIDKKITETNPYFAEWQALQSWSVRPAFVWRDTWQHAVNTVEGKYEREQIDTDFYRSKFKEVMPLAPVDAQTQTITDALPKKQVFEIVIEDFLAQWDALLSAKILTHQIEELDKGAGEFKELLHGKIDEYLKLVSIISPIATEAGRFWDMSKGLWKKASFDILDKYQALLSNEKAIQELADMLGRMREAQIELEEETFRDVIIRKEWVADSRLRDEINGIEASNEISRILPSEAAFLAEDAVASVFLKKFADQQLLTFKYEGKQLITSDKVNQYSQQKEKQKEKGPFVMCIDTSGSMFGLPAQIAKVLCFAIMKMAAKEKRKCFLINFSIGIKTIDLTDIAQSMDRIADFLSMSFDGGTDVTPALAAALDVLQTNDYKEADVLMVSDFVMFSIRKEIIERIQQEQHKGTNFHSLTISKKYNAEIVNVFDNCWIYDPESRDIMKQLLTDLHKINMG